MLFNYQATDPNEKTIQATNKVIALAKQRGFESEALLRAALNNPDIDMQMLSEYVDTLFRFINNDDVINLVNNRI